MVCESCIPLPLHFVIACVVGMQSSKHMSVMTGFVRCTGPSKNHSHTDPHPHPSGTHISAAAMSPLQTVSGYKDVCDQ